jgi:hypothetical protein
MSVSREALRRFIEGQRLLNALVREETWRRLARLTVEQAREEYEDLCRFWDSSPGRHDLGDLERVRLDELVRLRQRLDLAARRRVR